MIRLGVNIDHIATLRQARRDKYPDPVLGAIVAQNAGADQITLHLREDRRHINDQDLVEIKKIIKIPLNLEMALSEEIVQIALRVKPERVTLVPEKREEVTTEGGLDLTLNFDKVKAITNLFIGNNIEVSLFIDADKKQIDLAKLAGARQIELHTGVYTNANESNQQNELKHLADMAKYAYTIGLEVFAGHGLTYENVVPITKIPEITELNIGHNIIARSVFVGLEKAILEMKALLRR